MAGLLDQFSNLNEDQTQGLLAAAAQMLQQSGPSRTPTGLGQILGGGMGAYQDSTLAARKRKLDEQQAAQVAQMRGLQMQEMQGGLADRGRAREQADALRQFYMKPPGAAPQGMPQQGAQALDSMPQQSMPGMPQPAQPQGGQTSGVYQQRMDMAARLRTGGFPAEADAQEMAALKFQPKVKGWEKVMSGGKAMFAPFFEDGTSGAPVPLEVAEKLEKVARGGSTDLVNPYSGTPVASFKSTATPGEIMSDQRSRDRLNYDRNKESKPQFNAEVGGFISPPSKANPNGGITPLDGFDKRAPKAPTEFQGKSAAFGLRATEADKVLNELDGKYSPAAINSKQAVESTWLVGGALGAATNKFALSGNDQRAEQAQRDFINAVLRQESGAAIGANEFDNAKKQYFPQPGDGPENIAQKARDRKLAIQGFDANAGRHALTAPPKPAAGGWSITKKD